MKSGLTHTSSYLRYDSFEPRHAPSAFLLLASVPLLVLLSHSDSSHHLSLSLELSKSPSSLPSRVAHLLYMYGGLPDRALSGLKPASIILSIGR